MVEKITIEKSGVEKSGVEKFWAEKFLLALGLNCPGMKNSCLKSLVQCL